MSLSANCCLKRIRQSVIKAGFDDVSDARIREACLERNFDVKAAVIKLIHEEQLKVSLTDLCIQMGHNPSRNLIVNSCNRFKFQTFQVERYIKKLLIGRQQLKEMCVKAKVDISDEILDKKIIYTFGNAACAFNSLQQDHSHLLEHRL